MSQPKGFCGVPGGLNRIKTLCSLRRAVRAKKTRIWPELFICFSLAVLSCALMRYLVLAIHNSALCSYLCPNPLAAQHLALPHFLQQGFALQAEFVRGVIAFFAVTDSQASFLLARLVVAPVLEEGIYRGPVYLLKNMKSVYLWYGLAGVLGLLFVLSHHSAGLTYMPLVVLSVGSVWLIARTGRFWPSVLLHFLYNFQIVSRPFYDSFMWGG